jgi:hypothetical protein
MNDMIPFLFGVFSLHKLACRAIMPMHTATALTKYVPPQHFVTRKLFPIIPTTNPPLKRDNNPIVASVGLDHVTASKAAGDHPPKRGELLPCESPAPSLPSPKCRQAKFIRETQIRGIQRQQISHCIGELTRAKKQIANLCHRISFPLATKRF